MPKPDDPKQPPEESILWHQSGVAPTGEPFVQLLRNGEIFAQMSVEQARDHARSMLEAAEAAEQDAFIMDFAQHQIGLPFQEAGNLLVAFRNYRAHRTGKSQGPTRPTDWVMPPPDKMPDYGPQFRQNPSIDDYTKKPKKPDTNER